MVCVARFPDEVLVLVIEAGFYDADQLAEVPDKNAVGAGRTRWATVTWRRDVEAVAGCVRLMQDHGTGMPLRGPGPAQKGSANTLFDEVNWFSASSASARM